MVRSVHKLFPLHSNIRIRNMPPAYLDFLEQYRRPPERVHDSPPDTKYLDYQQDHQTGYVYRVPDHPIHLVNPPAAEKGLWGGLAAVEGFEKPKRLKPRITRVWHPFVERHTFYTEILDVHINIDVTLRTLELIDQHKGFDFYILQTPVQDLKSEFGRRLKHKMLVALAKDNRDYIKEKYKDHIRPLEEVQWHGLKEVEALLKFQLMRAEEEVEPPLKLVYAKQLMEARKSEKESQKELTDS